MPKSITGGGSPTGKSRNRKHSKTDIDFIACIPLNFLFIAQVIS